ncbi:MAG: L,D-transpeptidase family protein [Sphingobium sp.]|uniref:L,D-transpeptidase family protein n=1 Tax=Sphingobium sp. TaxID=1912891 RepID=UPI0029BE953A|nr:L,D-transpeptidase family protein [Sphingobium sp.]MDX3910767.1 L,D-transpeptidase family protein [Sphingobium sp.]
MSFAGGCLTHPANAAPARAYQRAELPAISSNRTTAVALATKQRSGGALRRFYASRGYRGLWASSGSIGKQAETLIGFLASADLDGLNPASYKVDRLRHAVQQAQSGDPELVAEAELALSTAFARYVRDQRRSKVRMTYADPALKPKKPRPETVLRAAAFPKSFVGYIADMGWMSPQYVRLRTLMAQAQRQGMTARALARLRLNLDRARLLPGPWTHHIVVDASSGRLWYYEAGRQAGTMRVVVGTKETPTPMLAGTLQWAIVNPYWNVPTYLARNRIAPKILAGRSLASLKMEALSDWSETPRKLEPSSVDWSAVASGTQEIRLRELPGPSNSMGRVKFLFPNDEGIYLHDTPDRDLLKKTDRHFSNGCIRLENAAELARWLLQKPLRTTSKQPEQAVPLPVQVPVYLIYLTAAATDGGVAFREDVYGWDQ